MLRGIAKPRHRDSSLQVPSGRLQVDGRFFARDDRRVRLHGVTYGPFAPNKHGEPFPSRGRARSDLAQLAEAGFNALRLYHVPPPWFLELVGQESELGVLVDVPWSKHTCFLDSAAARRCARDAVRSAAVLSRDYAAVWAISICNEISPDVVRWHGARKVERFLRELMDVAKQAAPRTLVTFANYPPTEYLDLAFLDFVTFNVYLHDRETFRRYLCRLQNLVGDKPIVLGEIGMDTLRHGETAQAEFLAGHTKEAMLCGLAGSFVFSYTDEWHTGNHTITDWAFGITEADRNPKPSYHALRELFEQDFCDLLPARPKVSVVVCSYNGGRTLGQCLESLGQVEYEDYEVIVVDDGSTDDTPEILRRFPWVRAIRQSNQGLSAARNAGLQAATGEVIAYTDSDCFVDADWLTLLVAQLQHSGAAAVGGPNLSPEDGWLAACVAASPGQPTHVLESDQVAEHIPGCNMAFRREALEAINGFDPQYRKAGDDVDVCWRLQQSGRWITFAPGAFVWHHRRQGPRAYLKQQAGYGDAEALLRFKHPDRFNGRGDGIWRGVMYATGLQGLRLRKAIIYSGTYATGLFQCIYQPTPAHWAMLPTTLEWHLVAALFVFVGLGWPWSFAVAGVMLAISVLVTAGQTAQARLERRHDGLRSRLVVFMLSYAQPLVRSWHRYRTRLFTAQPPGLTAGSEAVAAGNMPLTGRRTLALWTEQGHDRVQLLDEANRKLSTSRWGNRIGAGWTNWDLEIDCYPGTVVRVTTAQENYGGLKRVIRIQFRVHPRPLVVPLFSTVCLTVGVLSSTPQWLFPLAGVCAGLLAIWWWRSVRLAGHIVALFQGAAESLDLIPCAQPHGAPRSTSPDAGREATLSTE